MKHLYLKKYQFSCNLRVLSDRHSDQVHLSISQVDLIGSSMQLYRQADAVSLVFVYTHQPLNMYRSREKRKRIMSFSVFLQLTMTKLVP